MATLAAPVRLSAAVYRVLLRLLPTWFARGFAGEAAHVFTEVAQVEYEARGLAGLAVLWRRTLADLARGIWQERSTYSTFAAIGPMVRHALGVLRREPWLAGAVVCTIGLAVGSATAIYTLAYGILLRPLPFPDSERVMAICEIAPETTGYCVASPPNVHDLGALTDAVDHVGVARTWRDRFQEGAESTPLTTGIATPGFLRAHSVDVRLGRLFTDDELAAGDNRVIVLTHEFWQQWTGGDPEVLGRGLTLDGEEFAVVGVLTEASWVPEFGHARAWAPLTASPDNPDQRDWRGFVSVARVAEGATVDEARAELLATYAGLTSEYPDDLAGWELQAPRLREQLTGSAVPVIRLFALAVGCLLLVGCANVANLLIVRAQSRSPEIAVRAALGAGRIRLGTQLLVESAVLAFAGGAVGLGLAFIFVRLGIEIAPPGIPRIDEVGVDLGVGLFTVVLSLATAAAFGMLPAVRVSRTDVGDVLRGGRFGDVSTARIRRAILVVELALAVTLLAGAGLGIRGFLRLTDWDPGFEQNGLVVTWMIADFSQLKSGVEIADRFDEAQRVVAALPGIDSVGQASSLPLYGGIETGELLVDGGQPGGELHMVQHFDIAPGYFATLGVPILEGRDIQEIDGTDTEPVAVINEAMARRYWPGGEPLGAEVSVGGHDARVVGVVRDMRPFAPTEPVRPAVYWPRRQFPRGATYVVMRTQVAATSVEGLVRERPAAEVPDVEVTAFSTLRESAGRELVSPRFQVVLLVGFAGAALLLAAVGIYSIVSYGVAQRRREIGVRIALGARPHRITSEIVGSGVRLAVAGCLFGIGAAAVLGRSLESMLHGVSSTDPVALIAVAAFFVFVAAIASWIPARRAAAVDTAGALRGE